MTATDHDTTPPPATETALLGDTLVDPTRALPELLRLAPDAWTHPLTRRIADAIRTLQHRHDAITEHTVADTAGLTHHERVTLLEFTANATPWAAATHARIIHNTWITNRTLAIGRAIGNAARAGHQDEVLQLATEIQDLNTPHATTLQHVADALDPWLDDLEARMAPDATPTTNRTGLRDLDHIIGGLRAGQLIVAAGRPGSGKTVFGAQLALNTATTQPALMVSVEMAAGELLDRWIAGLSGLHATWIRDATFGPREMLHDGSITRAVTRLADTHLWIDDNPHTTVPDIAAAARRIPQLALIVVDYTQLLTPARRHPGNRQLEVAEISRGLKRLARDLDVPVVALAQLNRECEQRSNKRPQLSDLRESGSIEQDADVVMGLYRDEYYHPDVTPEPGVMEIGVLKQRNGPTGVAKVHFDADHQRVANLAKETHP